MTTSITSHVHCLKTCFQLRHPASIYSHLRTGHDPKSSCWRMLFLVLMLLLGGCASGQSQGNLPSGPDRSYVRWLEKQAMYNNTRPLLNQVSQTERMWLNNSAGSRPDILLNAAPTWMELTTENATVQTPLFVMAKTLLPDLASAGINGLFFGSLLEKGDLWTEQGKNTAPVSLKFDPSAGDTKQFQALVQSAELNGLQTGSTLTEGATGIGPDFILQTRMAPGSAGIYAMLEIPAAYWNLAPEKKGAQASSQLLNQLAENGLLPARIANEQLDWLPANGWALTDKVTGIDGKERRWLYRYFASVAQPVFMWNDPFGQAKKIFSAAIIQQTGLQGQSLAGLRLLPFLGLEAASSVEPQNYGLNTWLGILNDLAGQIHRYGGWVLQADAVPPSLVAEILSGSIDFCRDDASELAVCAALLEQKAHPLKELYEKWLASGIEISRLARGVALTEKRNISLSEDNLARESLVRANSGNYFANSKELLDKALQKPETAETFLLNFRASLPGLAFFGPEELPFLTSTAHAGDKPQVSGGLLLERKNSGLATASLERIYGTDAATLSFLFRLPKGGFWLTAMNFSSKKRNLSVPLTIQTGKPRIAGTDEQGKISYSGHKLQLYLDGYECVNVIFEKE